MENLFLQKNPLQDFLSSLIAVISTNEKTEFITGHVTFKLSYNKIYQMKTPIMTYACCYILFFFARSYENKQIVCSVTMQLQHCS